MLLLLKAPGYQEILSMWGTVGAASKKSFDEMLLENQIQLDDEELELIAGLL